MEKIIDKLCRTSIFNNKYYLRIENTSKRFVRDVQVDIEIWKKYNIGDEYNEK